MNYFDSELDMEIQEAKDLSDLVRFLDEKKIVCLYPEYWSKFTENFKSKIKDTDGFPKPLILAGWAGSNDYELRTRFVEQLQFILQYLDISAIKSYVSAFVLEDHFLTYEGQLLNPLEFSPLSATYINFKAYEKVKKRAFPYLKKLYEIKNFKMSKEKLIDLMFRFEEHGINKRKKWKDQNIEEICLALYSIYKEQLSLDEPQQDLYYFCEDIINEYEDSQDKPLF